MLLPRTFGARNMPECPAARLDGPLCRKETVLVAETTQSATPAVAPGQKG